MEIIECPREDIDCKEYDCEYFDGEECTYKEEDSE